MVSVATSRKKKMLHICPNNSTRIGSYTALGLAALLAYLMLHMGPSGAVSYAQDGGRVNGAAGIRGQITNAPVKREPAETENNGDGRVFSHASFETDLDISTFLARAREFADVGQYETAVRVLQRVLDSERQVLIRRGLRVYRPSDLAAIDLLLEWPPEALDAYRVVTDPLAGGIYSQLGGTNNERVLAEIVRRYFLSSYGDEAAYRLACYRLDHGDFADAYRLLTQLYDRYPDPSVSSEDILLRLAVAASKVGNQDAMRRAWERYVAGATKPLPPWTESVEKRAAAATETAMSSHVGNTPKRAPRLPSDAGDGVSLVSQWEAEAAALGADEPDMFERILDLLEFAWTKRKERPADKLAVDGERVWISNARGVRCFDSSGQEVWSSSGGVPFKGFASDQVKASNIIRGGVRNFAIWSAFDDLMEGRLSLIDGVLYRVEGSWFTGARRVRVSGSYTTTRNGSRLAAYDAQTGRLKWFAGGGEETSEGIVKGGRLLNAPVKCGDNVLVCVEKNDALRMVALDPASGSIAWHSLLCSYPALQTPPDAPVGIVVSGGTVFVATGQGAVFSVDGLNGRIHWATTYERVSDEASRYVNGRQIQRPATWEINTLYVAGQNLIVLPQDAPAILSFDRTSGELLYKVAAKDGRYPIGMTGRHLIVAGDDFLQARQIETGKPVWRRGIEEVTGRAALTDQGILLPAQNELRILAADTGKPEATLRVGLGKDVPIGNLLAQEGQLYATGLGHLLRISPVEQLRQELTRELTAEQNANRYLNRGQLYMRLGELGKAIADLRKAYDAASADPRQVRYEELHRERERLAAEEQKARDEFAWFSDDFERGNLGADYTAMQGQAEIKNGALHMAGDNSGNMTVRLNKEIPGNFRVRATGWQPAEAKRLSDLTFKMNITSPGGQIENLYAMFGTNWNVRNKLLVNNSNVGVTTHYLMKKGFRHQLELVRIGARIQLIVDDITVVDEKPRPVPDSSDSKTTLHLYGFGEDHFYDNLVITLLDSNGAELLNSGNLAGDPDALKARLTELDKQRQEISKEMAALREAGYARLEKTRAALFDALVKGAVVGGERAREYLEQAAQLAQREKEQQKVQVASIDMAGKQGDYRRAIEQCYLVASGSPGALLPPDPAFQGWMVTPAVWARLRINKLLAMGKDDAHAHLEAVVASRLNEMQSAPETPFEDLYSLMMSSPAVPSGIRAGLAAADAAEKKGNLAQAELILLDMADAEQKKMKLSGHAALAKFYENRGWLGLAYRTWRDLADTTEDAAIVTLDGNEKARPLAEAALARLAAAAPESPDYVVINRLPYPPYSLRWRRELTGYPLRSRVSNMAHSGFNEKHLFMYDYRGDTLDCYSVADGERVWQRPVNRGTAFVNRGHTIFNVNQAPYAISLLAGKLLWDSAESADTISAMARPRTVSAGRVIVLYGENLGGLSQISGYHAATGRLLWSRVSIESQDQIRTTENRVVDMVRQRRGGNKGYEYNCDAYDSYTGKLVDASLTLSTNFSTTAWTDEGLLLIEDGKLMLNTLNGDDADWEMDLAEQGTARLRQVIGSSLFMLQTGRTMSIFDLAARKILWTASNETEDGDDDEGPAWGKEELAGLRYNSAGYLPGTDEIWLTRQVRKGDQWEQRLQIVDAQTGTIQLEANPNPDENVQINYREALGNEDYLLVKYVKRKQEGRVTRTVLHTNRLVSLKTGKVVPESDLPKPSHRQDNESRRNFRPFLIGDAVVLFDGREILVYEHEVNDEGS